jgi:hypothetical protein
MNCGLLGSYTGPGKSPGLERLQEITVRSRGHWNWDLRNARIQGQIPKEFDWRYHHDIGWSSEAFAVACGIDHPMGAQSSFYIPGPNDSGQHEGVPLRRSPQPGDPPFGKAVAYVNTSIWVLARPHHCSRLVKHRPGLRPLDVNRSWHGRWSRRFKEVSVAAATLVSLVTLWQLITRT